MDKCSTAKVQRRHHEQRRQGVSSSLCTSSTRKDKISARLTTDGQNHRPLSHSPSVIQEVKTNSDRLPVDRVTRKKKYGDGATSDRAVPVSMAKDERRATGDPRRQLSEDSELNAQELSQLSSGNYIRHQVSAVAYSNGSSAEFLTHKCPPTFRGPFLPERLGSIQCSTLIIRTVG